MFFLWFKINNFEFKIGNMFWFYFNYRLGKIEKENIGEGKCCNMFFIILLFIFVKVWMNVVVSWLYMKEYKLVE